ncbi:hypothetical protein OJ998_01040 [Solirubrobacter taibaiensis]|nr:hypothetical protein [Solirubrobacter taibaiensis]
MSGRGETALPHALVVGGSGMLAGTCTGFARRGWRVSVVARDAAKLERLSAQHPAIASIGIDYRDTVGFRTAIGQARERYGPLELAVCWIRSSEPEALRVVAEQIADSGLLLHVLGTSSMASAVQADAVRDRLGSRYRRIVLGRVSSGHGWRWLSHAEISAGVLDAFDHDDAEHVVGALE